MKPLALILGFILSSTSFAADEFDRIWQASEELSPGLKSETYEKEAAKADRSRFGKHWLPRLSFGAEAISTNHPATTLFSTLASRSLQTSDLAPSVMNEPSRQWFRNAQLMIDLPLYEGGAGLSTQSGAEWMEKSRTIAAIAKRNEFFSSLVQNYATVLLLKNERQNLISLKEKLTNVISKYKVGSKNNPVGYSGLLGMRSLANRIDGAMDSNRVELESFLEDLRTRSGLSDLSEKTIQEKDPIQFVREKLGEIKNAESLDLRSIAQDLAARAHSEFAKSERARNLPKVGLFASESLTAGPRDSGTSSEYGAYLQWAIFDGPNRGAYEAASLRAQAFNARADESKENAKIGRLRIEKTLPVLLENVKRAEESSTITLEQTNVTESLFRNGSVSALQFAEVLARRTDLIENKTLLVKAVLQTMVENYRLNRGENESK